MTPSVQKGMKLLALHVFRTPSLGDCTNGGASGKYDEIYVLSAHGKEMRDPPLDRVFTVDNRGSYKVLVPFKRPTNAVGPMFGGNLASALTGEGGAEVYRVHDRFETREQYREMTRD